MKGLRKHLSMFMAALLVLSLMPVLPWTMSARAGTSETASGSDAEEPENEKEIASLNADGSSLCIVEFAATGYTAYALPKDQTASIAEITAAMGITGTAVPGNQTGLNGYLQWTLKSGEWYVTALKAPADSATRTLNIQIDGQTEPIIIWIHGKSVVASLSNATMDGAFASDILSWSGTVTADTGYTRPETLTMTDRSGVTLSSTVPAKTEGARYYTYDKNTGAVVIYGISDDDVVTVSGKADPVSNNSSSGGSSSGSGSSGSGNSASVKSWVYNGGSWYLYSNGTPVKNAWAFVNGQWYHFNSKGQMQTGWINEGGKWYYLDADTGGMATGLVNAPDGHTYYFNADGSMAVGDVVIDGVTHHFNDKVPSKPTYDWNAETETWEPNGSNDLPYGAEVQ